MKRMNEVTTVLALRDFMDRPEGWGRTEGREIYNRMLAFVEDNVTAVVFRVSLKGVKRIDISFASETVIELARRYRREKGFCLVDLVDQDIAENIGAAAERKQQPLLVWTGRSAELIGVKPSEGAKEAFQFAMARPQARATEFADKSGVSIANASMKFKQLWEQGFLLRKESNAETGGVEFIYSRIA